MKKISIIALSLLLIFTCIACGKKGNTLEGEWALHAIEENGKEYTLEEYTEMIGEEVIEIFESISLSISSDNKFTLNVFEDKVEGTISEKDGKYTFTPTGDDMDEDAGSGTLEDGKLKLNMGDGNMVFVKK